MIFKRFSELQLKKHLLFKFKFRSCTVATIFEKTELRAVSFFDDDRSFHLIAAGGYVPAEHFVVGVLGERDIADAFSFQERFTALRKIYLQALGYPLLI